MITAYVNLCSLSSWLSLEGLRSIQQKTGVEIAWYPLLKLLGNVTPPPKADDPQAAYKNRRAKARQQFLDAEHRRVCERLQITEAAGSREYNTLNVSLGLCWLTELWLTELGLTELRLTELRLTGLKEQAASNTEASTKPNTQLRGDIFFNYLEAAFAAHYRQGQNLEPLEAAVALLDSVKATTDGFAAFAEGKAEELANSAEDLLEKGILYSPAFLRRKF